MAFRTDGLARAYQSGQQEAARLKQFSQSAFDALVAGTVSANAVIQVLTTVTGAIAVFDDLAATPGLAQYARDQADDQAYDVVAEYQAMRAEAVNVRDWVINNFPTSAGGYIEKDTLQPDGSIVVRQFTNAQTAGLQTALTSLIATID